jgi:NADH:ubiquinone oxidoreductase subunit 6 (subunit J)
VIPAQVLLGVLTIASALVVVIASRPEQRSFALGVNSLSLAAIAWLLSAPLVALAWAMTGMAMMLVSLIALGSDRPIPGEAERSGLGSEKSRLLLAILIALAFAVSIAVPLVVSHVPAQVAVGEELSAQAEGSTARLATMLYTRYAVGVLGGALALVAAVLAARTQGRGG